MGKFILKRIVFMVPVVLVVTMVIFILSYLSAGDAARILAEKKYEHPTIQQIEEVRHNAGLDQPIMIQYGQWLSKAVNGDFGNSYATGKPAIYEIKRCIPYTIRLFESIPASEPRLRTVGTSFRLTDMDELEPENGCLYQNHCSQCKNICKEVIPGYVEVGKGHKVACHLQ